jgi:hypothetical protein
VVEIAPNVNGKEEITMTRTKKNWIIESALLSLAVGTSASLATVTVTQSNAPAPTYGTVLNFDADATGPAATNAWAGLGLADINSGDGAGVNVDDWSSIVGPWIGSGNSILGNFGIFMSFGDDLTNFSAQVWDPSGGPPFGGLGVFVFDDGVEVANSVIEPAWGGAGDTWIDITAADGMVFDEIRLVGFGFDPSTFADNMSWNAVPAPSALALLGLGGITMTRRRR